MGNTPLSEPEYLLRVCRSKRSTLPKCPPRCVGDVREQLEAADEKQENIKDADAEDEANRLWGNYLELQFQNSRKDNLWIENEDEYPYEGPFDHEDSSDSVKDTDDSPCVPVGLQKR